MLVMSASWLAVPIETLNVVAISTRRVLEKAVTVNERKKLKSSDGSSRDLLKFFLVSVV
jgi:hypothetical protein